MIYPMGIFGIFRFKPELHIGVYGIALSTADKIKKISK